MGDFEEIHVWCGFPCVDLSAVKSGRKNLSGEHSSLIYEAVRVMKELKQLYPDQLHFHIVENVASVDVSARDQINELLGEIPYRVDPSNQVPMSRPRFCWTNIEVEGVAFRNKEGYVEIQVSRG